MFDPLPVDPDAMPAGEVFQKIVAVDARDLGMIAGYTRVAQHEIVVGGAAHPEGERKQGHAHAPAVRVHHDKGRVSHSCFCRRYDGCLFRLGRLFRLGSHERGAAAAARSTSCARSDWQCEQ